MASQLTRPYVRERLMIFIHLPKVQHGRKFGIKVCEAPSFFVRQLGFNEQNCWVLPIDTNSVHSWRVPTNRQVLELYFSSVQFEKEEAVVYNGTEVCRKSYEILHAWLRYFAGIHDRTAKAMNAKVKSLQKKYLSFASIYNRVCGDKQGRAFIDFLDQEFTWGKDYSVQQQVRHVAVSPMKRCAASLSPSTLLRNGTEVTGNSSEVDVLMKENKQLQRKLNKELACRQSLENENETLTKCIGVRMRDVLNETEEKQRTVDHLRGKLKDLNGRQRNLITRKQHEDLVADCKSKLKDAHQVNLQLELRLEAVEKEAESLRSKAKTSQRTASNLKKTLKRKHLKLESLRTEINSFKEQGRLDKDAADLYQSGIIEHLQQEVEEHRQTANDMRDQLDALKTLETRNKGKYNANIRLLYYDLLTKNVSCNTIQSVVRSVLDFITPVDAESVVLPSRSSAQRMLSEAGELVKIRAAVELARESGDLGHHSDGTTKSLIHWGTHILKLGVGEERQTFTLTVSPVASGKASDTVSQLLEEMDELRQLADLLQIEYDEDTYSVARIGARMSDRAANERAVGKELLKRKTQHFQEDPGWQELSEAEQLEKVSIREWTCAAHKVDNMVNAMTNATCTHLHDASNHRQNVGAKKLIYETNKLICEQSRKEYGRGKAFKMFAMDADLYKDSAAHIFQPIVGNRYLVYLLNALPTLLSKDAILLYLESLKDSKVLNRLELSVYQQYIDVRIEAELCAFSIMYYYVCNPLLCRAKAAKSPLEMNGFYRAAIMKLGEFEDDPTALVSGTASLWPTASPKDKAFDQYMDVVLLKTEQHKDMVIDLLRIMTAAGRAKLRSHSVEHLPGGLYAEPSPRDLAAASILGSATNDIVESCFGVLDREQTRCPVRNPLNTSALVTSKKDRPVEYARAQDEDVQELMVKVAMKSATTKRKRKGTRLVQEQNMWRKRAPEREAAAVKRQLNRNKRQKHANKLMDALQKGMLIRDPTSVAVLRTSEVDEQFQLWCFLVKSGLAVTNMDGLKGYSSLRIAAKKEQLSKFVQDNILLQVDLAPDAPVAPPPEHSDCPSSSDEEEGDTQPAEPSCFKFRHLNEWVAVAFSGGAWYAGQVTKIVSEETADVTYLHPISSGYPLQQNAKFRWPGSPDVFSTDADSIFMQGFDVTPVSARRPNTLVLSVDVEVVNNLYLEYARNEDIPLH